MDANFKKMLAQLDLSSECDSSSLVRKPEVTQKMDGGNPYRELFVGRKLPTGIQAR
jgi:hypothetical protein